jgi:hypothetical protein
MSRVEELNERIYSRNQGDVPAFYFSPRPVPTKYTTLPILDQRMKEQVDITCKPIFDTSTQFLPGSNGPWSGKASTIDIETQLREDISGQEVSLNDSSLDTESNKINKTKLKLTNHPDQISTNMFISTFSIDNASTQVNIDNGYRTVNHMYDKKNKKYTYKTLDSISDVGDGTQIVMKDLPGKNNGLTKFCRTTEYLGKMDTDNVHENYLYSYSQNMMNLDFLQKIKLIVTLSQPNFTLYRFQKVLVEDVCTIHAIYEF